MNQTPLVSFRGLSRLLAICYLCYNKPSRIQHQLALISLCPQLWRSASIANDNFSCLGSAINILSPYAFEVSILRRGCRTSFVVSQPYSNDITYHGLHLPLHAHLSGCLHTPQNLGPRRWLGCGKTASNTCSARAYARKSSESIHPNQIPN